jgi:hypothetical protein
MGGTSPYPEIINVRLLEFARGLSFLARIMSACSIESCMTTLLSPEIVAMTAGFPPA